MAGTPNKETGDVAPILIGGVLIGGFSAEKPANEEVQALVDSLQSDILKQCGANATKCEVISYQEQVVAGTNYRVKVDIGGAVCLLKIFKPHTGEGPKLICCEKI